LIVRRNQRGNGWGDVDWELREVYIQRAVVERKLKETKTRSSNRKVLLLPAAYDALKHQKQFSFVGSDYIFVQPDDKGPFIDYEHLERPWKHILKTAKVRYRNPTPVNYFLEEKTLCSWHNKWGTRPRR
jgi:integrase